MLPYSFYFKQPNLAYVRPIIGLELVRIVFFKSDFQVFYFGMYYAVYIFLSVKRT